MTIAGPRSASPCGAPAVRRISSRATPLYFSVFLSCGFTTVSVIRGIAFRSATVKVSGVETAPLTFSSAALAAAVCAHAEVPVTKSCARATAAKRHRCAELLPTTGAYPSRCSGQKNELTFFQHYFSAFEHRPSFTTDFLLHLFSPSLGLHSFDHFFSPPYR